MNDLKADTRLPTGPYGRWLGGTDLGIGAFFMAAGGVGALLEPTFGSLWLILPLSFAVPFFASGSLLFFSRGKAATRVAMGIHVITFCASTLLVLLSLVLIATILMAGFGIILFTGGGVVALNSAFAFWAARARLQGVPN